MKFRTELHVGKAPFELSHKSMIAMQGSCFAENLGQKHMRYGFKTNINSHGILFNPLSICRAISDVLEQKQYTEKDLIEVNGKWVSLQHHGRFSHTNAQQSLDEINASIKHAHELLLNAEVIVITLGSAWAWQYKANGQVVANCHKLPQAEFQKVLIQADQIIEYLEKTVKQLQAFNPKLNIVFTVSPVRYLRDGLVQNNLSKAQLLTAVHHISNSKANCSYFPAYELVIDDLRDYRYFKEDMLHPSQQAIDYVWEKWQQWCFSEGTLAKLHEMEPLLLLLEHKPLAPNDENLATKLIEAKSRLEEIILK